MFNTSVINSEISNDIEQSLKFAQSMGFDAIEIHSAWGKNIETLDISEMRKLKQLVKSYNLKVSCISSTLFLRCFLDNHFELVPEVMGLQTISGDYNFHLNALQQAFIASEILEAPIIRVFGFQKENKLTEETFTMAAEKFRIPVAQAKEAGITLALENCPHTSFGWGKNAAKLVQLINSPAFRLLWDPANGVRAGEVDCIQSLPTIIPLLALVHAKDILQLPDGDFKYLAVGQGAVPWKVIFHELKKNKYEGMVSIETHFIDNDGSNAGAVKESFTSMNKILSTLSLPGTNS